MQYTQYLFQVSSAVLREVSRDDAQNAAASLLVRRLMEFITVNK